MKRTLKELAQFAFDASQKKFSKLSSKKQHELIAAMASDCLMTGQYNDFLSRYEELQTWVNLDQYLPPVWLSEKEALREFSSFHGSFSPTSVILSGLSKNGNNNMSWDPMFEVSVMVDQIRSPFNAGSILRIIDNFGFKEFIHSTSTLSLNHPQLVKSARGSEKWIPVRFEENPLQLLENSDIPVVGIEKTNDAVNIEGWNPPDKCILVVGNEEYGISESILERCTQKVQIPMYGFKKSMNVHHALAVVAQRFVAGKQVMS